MRLALAPLNPTVARFDENLRLALDAAHHAAEHGAHLLLLPELAITAYPPRDLLLHQGFLDRARTTALRFTKEAPPNLTVLLGCPWQPPLPHNHDNDPAQDPAATDTNTRPTNSLLVIRDNTIIARHDKRLLPDYDVFDETRYFRPGTRPTVFDVPTPTEDDPHARVRVGGGVCEDLWRGDDTDFHNRYAHLPDPLDELKQAGAQLVCVASASPFIERKASAQSRILQRAAARTQLPVAAVNLAGANDDLIFDAHAAVYAPTPDGAACLAANTPFDQHTLIADIEPDSHPATTTPDPYESADTDTLLTHAITTGIRDYAHKSGFTTACLGLSGGIDSALVAALAAIALGPRNITALRLPSRFSSQHSLDDAKALADNLGITLADHPIEPAHHTFETSLAQLWQSPALKAQTISQGDGGVTEENIQSRIRGLVMMALSNKTGALLLTTGNKSEHATGYATLYGDQNGGLAPIADLLKTEVYRLSNHINMNHQTFGLPTPPIPTSTITKPPSAELRPDQTDQDTLPPYDTLDDIIERYVDRRESPEHIASSTKHDPALIDDIVKRIDRNEHKRFQLCVALKLRPRAFGPGRRIPIVNHPPQSSDTIARQGTHAPTHQPNTPTTHANA